MSLKGKLSLPSDKSITHRAILFSALVPSLTDLQVYGVGRDNIASLRAIGSFGAKISASGSKEFLDILTQEDIEYSFLEESSGKVDRILIDTREGLKSALEDPIEVYCGNSGTTARLLCGLVAGLGIPVRLSGDSSLSARPFGRIKKPLEEMGATLSGEKLPLSVSSSGLQGIEWRSPVASAQVKSAVLLAGLFAEGETSVLEPRQSRDHTERMLRGMGASIRESEEGSSWRVSLLESLPDKLGSRSIIVPGDFSAAAFFIVGGLICADSDLVLQGVGINSTRVGLLKALKRMGGDIELLEERNVAGETVADIRVRSSHLTAIETEEAEIVDGIDEVPALALACAFAEGTSVISKAEELRVKECDRLKYMALMLETAGVEVEELPDGLRIKGSLSSKGIPGEGLSRPSKEAFWQGSWRESHDHRIEMCASILGKSLYNTVKIDDLSAVETSFPSFRDSLAKLSA